MRRGVECVTPPGLALQRRLPFGSASLPWFMLCEHACPPIAWRAAICLLPLCYEQVGAHAVAIRAEVQPLPVA